MTTAAQNQLIERIEQWLSGQLSYEEAEEMELSLQNNPDMVDLVEAQRQAMHAVRLHNEQLMRERIGKWREKQAPRPTKPLPVFPKVTAWLLVLVFSLFCPSIPPSRTIPPQPVVPVPESSSPQVADASASKKQKREASFRKSKSRKTVPKIDKSLQTDSGMLGFVGTTTGDFKQMLSLKKCAKSGGSIVANELKNDVITMRFYIHDVEAGLGNLERPQGPVKYCFEDENLKIEKTTAAGCSEVTPVNVHITNLN